MLPEGCAFDGFFEARNGPHIVCGKVLVKAKGDVNVAKPLYAGLHDSPVRDRQQRTYGLG